MAGRKGPAPKAPAPVAPVAAYVTTKAATALICHNAKGAKDAAIAARAGAFVYLLTQGALLRDVLQEKRPEAWQALRKAVVDVAGKDEGERWATDCRKLAALWLDVNLTALRNEGEDVTQEESKALHGKAVAALAALAAPKDGKAVAYAGAVARAVAAFKGEDGAEGFKGRAFGNPHGLRNAFAESFGKLRNVAEGAKAKTKDEGAKDEGAKDEGAKAPAFEPIGPKAVLANAKTALADIVARGFGPEDVTQAVVRDVLRLALAFANEATARDVATKAGAIADKLSPIVEPIGAVVSRDEGAVVPKAPKARKSDGPLETTPAPKAATPAPAPKAATPKAAKVEPDEDRKAAIAAREGEDVAKAAKAKDRKAGAVASAILRAAKTARAA
jgi:hypothetical protein